MRCHLQPQPSLRRRPGVTLTEILVVMAIISVLAGLSYFTFSAAKRVGDKSEGDAVFALAQLRQNRWPEKRSTPILAAPVIAEPMAAPAPRPAPRPVLIPGLYYVGFNAGVTDPAGTAQRLAGAVGGRVVSVYTNVISGFGLQCDDTRIKLLQDDPAVQFMDQARYVYPCQSAPKNIQRVFSNGIHGSQKTAPTTNIIYGVPTTIYRFSPPSTVQGTVTSRFYRPGPNAQTTVAILDTGIDATHPDLNVVAELDFTGNGNPRDTHGHGTHIAGVVGARNQVASGGVVGVYPGAPLINLKVMAATTNNTGSNGNITNITGGGGNMTVFTTSSTAGLKNGDSVTITGVVSTLSPNPNSTFNINTITANSFNLIGTGTPTGAYTSGGTWTSGIISLAGEGLPAGSNLNVYSALSNYVIPNSGFVRVCLMSFETSFDPVMNQLVNAAASKGVLMVAAAGNSGGTKAASSISPAGAGGAIVVGALRDSDGLPGGQGGGGDDSYAAYSNVPPGVDFAAPGGDTSGGFYQITSTIPIAGQTKNGLAKPYSAQVFGTPGAGNAAFGTSFAAAHVAGTLALVTDTRSTIGFVVGGRGVTSFAPLMTSRAGAVNALTNLTHQTTDFQMISPLTGSAWTISGSPRRITRYTKRLFDDRVNGIPVPNLYVNPGQAPSNLLPFPG
jgi:prepilin-type N-terminal cleavage/methylation domain-containing protein